MEVRKLIFKHLPQVAQSRIVRVITSLERNYYYYYYYCCYYYCYYYYYYYCCLFTISIYKLVDVGISRLSSNLIGSLFLVDGQVVE